AAIGLPCVVKPVMSSSGKGQSTVRGEADIGPAWDYAQTGGRTGAGRCIVEGFVDFDSEITLLTVRHAGGTSFCAPIGHLQGHGVPVFGNLDAALRAPDSALRLFGKPRVDGQRRVGVTLARADSIDAARTDAREATAAITIELQ